MNSTLFFDLDGPILDVSKKYFAIYSALVSELGGTPLESQEYWRRKRTCVPEQKTLLESQLGEIDFETYRLRRKELIETPTFWRHDIVWPEVLEAINFSPWKGRIVLVTLRNNRDALRKELQQLGIASWFDTVLSTGGDAAGPDRHNAKVQLINDHFSGSVPSGWFVGDTETDLRTGKALRLETVATTFGIRSETRLRDENPDHLAHTPAQLAAWLKGLPTPTSSDGTNGI